MSVRLVRQASDTPNITNRDDSRMTRYAYGGNDGVMKGFGSELSHSISGSTFILNSGCIVLHGWEVVVDSWELDLSTVVSTQYHTVYLEVSVASESATIKSTYQTGAFPSIDVGNDLTTYPNGTARLPLYTFTVTSGIISSVTKKFSLLSYYGERLNDIEKRLTNLGFKEGSVSSPNVGTSLVRVLESSSTAKRQGNYVVGSTHVKFDNNNIAFLSDMYNNFVNFGKVSSNIIPLKSYSTYAYFIGKIGIWINLSEGAFLTYYSGIIQVNATISEKTGEITIESPVPTVLDSKYEHIYPTELIIQFGYEAKPLT